MNNIDTKKILRLFIGALLFLCVTSIIGITQRAAHQLFFALFVITLFAIIVKNIWLTLFVFLSAILFTVYKFEAGQIYMTNIFYGTVLFYITKLAFEKKHIDWFINLILWLVVVNIFYGILQVLDFDFMFFFAENLNISGMDILHIRSPNGFMGNSGITGCLYALAIPLIATRSRKSIWLALVMFIPIFLLRSSISMAAGVVAFMFILWLRVGKKVWFTALGGILVASCAYLMFFDLPGMERIPIWRSAITDAKCHPIKGWGMDSFRKVTTWKNQMYFAKDDQGVTVAKWDNPHNLYISLFYEWGFLALILLGGYFRQLIISFRKSLQDNNTVALAGFILAFFVVSLGSFPIFLARMAVIIIPCFALYDVAVA